MTPLAVSEGFVVAAVVVSAATLVLYLVITASRTATVSRRLDELEAELDRVRPAARAQAPAAPGAGAPRTGPDSPAEPT